MIKLPSLASVLDKGVEPANEFKRILEKLFLHEGMLKGYEFEPVSAYGNEGFDGIVRNNYEGVEGPVLFRFKWVKGPINVGKAEKEIKNSLEKAAQTGMEFKSYVLVTPHDLSEGEKEWLEGRRLILKLNFSIHHWGHSKIQALLAGFPALEKYYYGGIDYPQDLARDFIVLEKQYRRRVFEEHKGLHFFGIPTGSYKQQYSLQKPDLTKLYIPLEFHRKKDVAGTVALEDIGKESLRVVVLGDPGSGKTTLVHYLALLNCQKPGGKIPFIIPIRNWVRKQREKSTSLDFIDYLKYTAEENYNFKGMDNDFFVALLELEKALVVFDGLDEAFTEEDRIKVARAIDDFSYRYPGAVIWVTSRLMGYTPPVILNPDRFDLYYLAPVTMRQARAFIKKWYEIQVPVNKAYRDERIRSLWEAIEKNPGVKRLQSNPLLLTILTLIHQFEGTLPDNRAKLYEKCVELLLKTWQEQKYSDLGVKNPLEERGLKYDIQLKLLAAAAFHLQEKSLKKGGGNPRVIEEQELANIFLKTRFDKQRMGLEKAREDVHVFIDFIRDRAGLLVERGRNEKDENLFSFAHLSFLEYLAAYHMAEDRSKSQEEHIRQLLEFYDNPAFFEPILLTLQLFSRSTGLPFIDAFVREAFKKLSRENNSQGWFLVGRAVRDNINFARDDMKRIIRQIAAMWLADSEGSTAFSLLKEIVHFSVEGKRILKKVIKDNIKNNPAGRAFKALLFYEKYYRLDPSLISIISRNKHIPDLLPYLPVFRKNNIIYKFIRENLELCHWVIYYNSTGDKTLENLRGLLKSYGNPLELKAYLLSSWYHILNILQDRCRLIATVETASTREEAGSIVFDFAGYAAGYYPSKIFRPLIDIPVSVALPLTIKEKMTIPGNKSHPNPVDKRFSRWIDKMINAALSESKNHIALAFHHDEPDQKGLITGMSRCGEHFLKDFLRCLHREPIRNFLIETLAGTSAEFLRRFIRSLTRYLTGDFIQGFLQGFNRYLIREMDQGILLRFCKEFTRYIDPGYLDDFIRDFLNERIRDLSQSFKDEISRFYRRRYRRELKWDNLDGEDFERLYHIYNEGLTKGDSTITGAFFRHLYEYLFVSQFKVSFHSPGHGIEPAGESTPGSRHRLTMAAPMVIPFAFAFRLISALDHYLVDVLWDLYTRFYPEGELNIHMILRAIDEYLAKNPFVLYLADFTWEFYADDFYQRHREARDNEMNCLELAAIVMDAAKISLVTGIPCEGGQWENILADAGKKSPGDIFLNISLTLYKLCHSREIEKNSVLLKTLLERLKHDFPDEYRLTGFY